MDNLFNGGLGCVIITLRFHETFAVEGYIV